MLRRIREGGSWHVQVSLSATAQWLQSLGRIAPAQIPERWSPGEGLDRYLKSCQTGAGRLEFLGPVVQMSERRQPSLAAVRRRCRGADEARWTDLHEDMHAA